MKKRFKVFLALSLVLTTFSLTTSVNATTVESKYSTVGDCNHGDRVTNLYADRFFTEITYDIW